MVDVSSQLSKSGFNRILIIGSVLNYRRSLAMSLIKLLPNPTFSALDPADSGLPDENYDWSSVDVLFVDLSEYKSQIRTWYFEISNAIKLMPVIFLDNRATVDDAGDMVRAGAADYIDITRLNTRRLSRALLIADSLSGRVIEAVVDSGTEPESEPESESIDDLAATQILPSVSKDGLAPSSVGNFPPMAGMTDEPTEVLPILTPAMLAALQEDPRPEEKEEDVEASFLTEDMLNILARRPSVEVEEEEESSRNTNISDAAFLTTGLMSILDKGRVLSDDELPKHQPMQAAAFSVGKRWPFSQQDLDKGVATLGDYQMLEFVAVGGTASVFKAQPKKGGDVLAIKLFDNEIGAEDSHERCLRGYRLIQQVKHPNIVDIKELVLTGEHAFVAMEYITGGDLKSHIARGVSRQQAVRYTAEIAQALQAAHQFNIVHRDLKPSNILIRADGSLALLDFGIASLMNESQTHLTQEGFMVGTSHYVCPEQAVGGALDARSDLYSLGIILYEMLEGKRPYKGKSPTEIMQQHVYGPVPVLSGANDPLNAVVGRLTAKSPNDRYSSGIEVVSALTSAIPGLMAN